MMNKYDLDKLDCDIEYPTEAEDERSVQRRWQAKKAAYCITKKPESASR